MRDKLGDKVRLDHVVDSIIEIENAVKDVAYDDFLENHVLRIAVVKWIEIIGEASVSISAETKMKYKEIDWPAIKGMRNIAVHEYFGIKYDLIWEVVKEHIPVLKRQVLAILKELN